MSEAVRKKFDSIVHKAVKRGDYGRYMILREVAETSANNVSAIAELRQVLEGEVRLRERLARNVGGISDTLGAIVERDAREAILRWLSSKGLTLDDDLAPLRIVIGGKMREIDMHGYVIDTAGVRKPIYAEAKARIRLEKVRQFAEIVEEAERQLGKGLKILAGYVVYRDALEEAQKRGVVVVRI